MRPHDEAARGRPGLTWRQKLVAGAVTAAAIAGGVNGIVQAVSAGTEYGCKHGWWTAGCTPRTTEAAPDGRR